MNKPNITTDGVIPASPRRRQDNTTRAQPQLLSHQPTVRPVLGTVESVEDSFAGALMEPTPKVVLASNRPVAENMLNAPSAHGKTNKRKWFKFKMKKSDKHPKRKRKFWFKLVSLSMAGILVLIIGFIGFKAWVTISNVITRAGAGSPLLNDIVTPRTLNGEGDGRVNIMLLGIGGEGHEAGDLADTILVASIDPTNNEAGLLSIPRDLYVSIPGYGKSKINAAHTYGEQYAEPGVEAGGALLMQETLEQTLGITIHYFVVVDFTGFKEAVDAVGGIDITLENRVYDPIFDREYGSHALDIGPGEVHLSGLKALLLGRARGSTGGVGLARSDFDRAEHQRMMLVALRDKILSTGTYTNPLKINQLLSALGGHVKTNIQIDEMLRLRDIGNNITSDKVISYGLNNAGDNFLTSSNIGGASVLLPRDGTFLQIQEFVRSIFVDGFIKSEAAVIDVYNGTTTTGLATTKSLELESYGYTIGVNKTASDKVKTTRIFDLTGGAPFTLNYLEKRFKVSASSLELLPKDISSTADILIILGSDQVEVETTTN